MKNRKRISRVRIEVLADHQELIETVARWQDQEWGHLTPQQSLAARVTRVREAATSTYVALQNRDLLGMAGLVDHDMDTHPELGPWLAGVYTRPEVRGRGIAAALSRYVAAVASARGAEKLYLYTDEAQAFWEHLGWYRIAREQYLGTTVSIMETDAQLLLLR